MIRTSPIPVLRTTSRCAIRFGARSLRRLQPQPRSFASQPSESESEPVSSPKTPALDTQFDIFKSSLQLPKATGQIRFQAGEVVTLYGFIGKRRDKGSNLSFCDIDIHLTSFALHTPSSPSTPSTLQIVSNWEEEGSQQHTAHLSLKSIPAYSPVLVRGTLENIKDTTEANDEPSSEASVRKLEKKYEVRLEFVQCLNTFPKDIIVSKDAVWPPKSRHLQIRFDPLLYERLKFRSDIAGLFGQKLREAGFTEVETPVLFKSTPEGAREFLVPTRQKGFAYALPQSPQQYKQLLMASGVKRYFQLAKCFRDEDHRADRQPEFTQLDIEMAFATMGRVIKLVSSLIRDLDKYLQKYYAPVDINGVWHPRSINRVAPDGPRYNLAENTIQNIHYDKAMNQYGTDKPDLRLRSHVSNITKISEWLSEDFKRMITSLKDPTVEACKFRFTGSSEESAEFIRDLFDTLPNTPHKLSGDSTPGVFVFDSSKPLQGLSALGHEAAEMLVGLQNKSWPPFIDGDVVIVHARKRAPHRGGSTELGRLRKLIYDTAVEKGLLPKDRSFHFCWVTRFPLFTPNDDGPGQGGSAGFSSTHHPFTAPLRPDDVDLLRTDPLKAKAAHYDLVLNGVEIGGGSRRIHVAEVQEYIMRDVLKMTDEGVGQFSHLLEALRAGCPPHAGFAMGFDRLIAVLCDVPSVRDVIAFPKNNKGEDPLVGSPSKTTPAQQKTYHLFTEPESTTTSP